MAINCGALTPTLVESQLFGHTRGAFSGASRDEPGLVRAADGGTLLLDEIGDLPEAAQPALLRVLQEREVVAVGGTKASHVNVRVIAATHRPLDRLSESKCFRPDLLARLDEYRFVLPPLAERKEDIGLVVADILRRRGCSALLAPEAGRELLTHSWPYNVRELVREIDRAIILAPSSTVISPVTTRLTGPQLTAPSMLSKHAESVPPLHLSEADAELKEELLTRLNNSRGNITEVARQMGKARMQIHRWMKRFGISRLRHVADRRTGG